MNHVSNLYSLRNLYYLRLFSETGGLFGLAIRLMQLFSDCKYEFKALTDILGLYFQIRDDYANLCMKEVGLYFWLT